MARFLCSLVVTTALFPWLASGFSTGAGGCSGGEPAVGSTHLGGDRTVRSTGLSEAGISVTIDGVELSTTEAIDVAVGSDLALAVVDGSTLTYLGVLVRLEAPDGVDTTTALSPEVNMQDAGVCVAPIVGLTHANSNEKSLSTGILRFDEAVSGVFLDVTVVFSNNAQQGSVYAYDRLEVNFVEDSSLANDAQADTASPVATTTAPTTSPGTAATATPTSTPGTTEVPTVFATALAADSLAPSTAAPSQSSPPSFISEAPTIVGTPPMDMRWNMMNMMGNRGGQMMMMMLKGKKGMMKGMKAKKGGKKQHSSNVNRTNQRNPWHTLNDSQAHHAPSRGIFRSRTPAQHTLAASSTNDPVKRMGLFSVSRYRTGPFLQAKDNF